MSLSSLIKTAIPAAIGFATGGPAGAFAASVGSLEAVSYTHLRAHETS